MNTGTVALARMWRVVPPKSTPSEGNGNWPGQAVISRPRHEPVDANCAAPGHKSTAPTNQLPWAPGGGSAHPRALEAEVVHTAHMLPRGIERWFHSFPNRIEKIPPHRSKPLQVLLVGGRYGARR